MFKGVIPSCGVHLKGVAAVRFANLPSHCTTRLRSDPEEDNLIAAGQRNRAGASSDMTSQLIRMATAMKDPVMLSKLSAGDLTAYELFYHLKCYAAYQSKYEKYQREAERFQYPGEEVTDDVICQAYALNDIITFIVENNKKHKMVDLVSMYNSKLDPKFHFCKTLPLRKLLEAHMPLLRHDRDSNRAGTVVFLEVSISREGEGL